MFKIIKVFVFALTLPTTTLLAQSVYPENAFPTQRCENTRIEYPKPFLKKRAYAALDSDNTFAFSIGNNNSLTITVFEHGPKICDPYFDLESPVHKNNDSILGHEIVAAKKSFAFNYSQAVPNYPAMLVSSFYLTIDANNCVARFWTNDYRNLTSAIEYLEHKSQNSVISAAMLQFFENVQSKIPEDITQIIYQARQ